MIVVTGATAGIARRRADLAEPESLRPVLDGADTLFLFPHGPADALVAVAKAGGVRRIVLLSSQGAGTRPDACFTGFERAVRTAAAPFGDVALPFVDPADVAEVAAEVLLGNGHAGRVYELTGPAPLTPRQRAHAIGDALGTAVRFLEQSPADARAGMLTQATGPIADATLALLGDPLLAEQRVSPDVERILGRPARPFSEWAARSAAAFA
ncbi:NmrA family transcriptional regulator [Amycolatopsis sp. NBC_00345]|uniref:NmrA family transcriptional regulator n=1 Tax=Amycolatopsis sp. NBC_00345 TaxID=2975955 RepID=UPI002E26D70C